MPIYRAPSAGGSSSASAGVEAAPLTVQQHAVTFASTPGTLRRVVTIDADREMLLLGGTDGPLHAVVLNKTTNTMGAPALVRNANVLFHAVLAGTDAVLVVSCPSGGTAMQAVVLTLAGTTITVNVVNAPAAVTLADALQTFSAVPSLVAFGTAFVVSYGRNVNVTALRAITISGTDATIGEEHALAGIANTQNAVLVAASGTVLLAFHVGASSLTASPFTLSGTTLTQGTRATQTTDSTLLYYMGQLSTGRWLLGFNWGGYARVALVSLAGTVASITETVVSTTAWSSGVWKIVGDKALVVASGRAVASVVDTAGVVSAPGWYDFGTALQACPVGDAIILRNQSSITSQSYWKIALNGTGILRTPLSGPQPSITGSNSVIDFPNAARNGYGADHVTNNNGSLWSATKALAMRGPFCVVYDTAGPTDIVRVDSYGGQGASAPNESPQINSDSRWFVLPDVAPSLLITRVELTA